MQILGFLDERTERIFWRIMEGVPLTVELTLGSLLVGLVIGLLLAVMRLSPVWQLRYMAVIYIEFMRGIPMLVLLLAIYFGLPALLSELGISITGKIAAISAFGLCYGAYLAEVFRAGIQSIDRGQTEAARALGLSAGQTMRFVVLPQAVRNVLPALVNQAVSLLKDTSLASAIAVAEITQMAQIERGRTFASLEIWVIVGGIYLVLTLALTGLARFLEREKKGRVAAPAPA